MYIIYGGTKTMADKKELFRNIFNQQWDYIPAKLQEKVKELYIPLFMITSAGAEGISLINVQYVHLMEPYWNQVRIDQVIGRARRICSHNTLPEKDRFVEVHSYVSVFPPKLPDTFPEGLKSDLIRDTGVPGTTDEYLSYLARKKRSLTSEVMDCIQRASIDCSLHGKKCLPNDSTNEESLLYLPDIEKDVTTDADVGVNKPITLKYITKDKKKILEFSGEDTDFVNVYTVDDKVHVGYIKDGTLYTLDKKKTSLGSLIGKRY